jgi:hypothetical protein
MGDNLYSPIFKKTLLEFISEIQDILQSGRYEVPEIIQTDLQMAKIVLAAATNEIVTDIMITFGKFMLQFSSQIEKRDTDFFNRLNICRACVNGTVNNHQCQCLPICQTKCECSHKCPNCSELLKDLDSKTFVAAKYVIEQAIEDSTPDKKEDIDVIFSYISSLLAAAKNYKKR